jgi:hypothetical protein
MRLSRPDERASTSTQQTTASKESNPRSAQRQGLSSITGPIWALGARPGRACCKGRGTAKRFGNWRIIYTHINSWPKSDVKSPSLREAALRADHPHQDRGYCAGLDVGGVHPVALIQMQLQGSQQSFCCSPTSASARGWPQTASRLLPSPKRGPI